ncbi:NusG domain II-containing protein, partial [Enterococcus cecorum]|uniref:NusG domain II-containing protein n=1 Tax=Enterococcus cecorum TaxID=44008 RepID=UPI001FAC1B4B
KKTRNMPTVQAEHCESEGDPKRFKPSNSSAVSDVDKRLVRIRVKEDNSPDQIAVRTGWIDTVGQTSICLPHQLIITIEQEDIDNYHIY